MLKEYHLFQCLGIVRLKLALMLDKGSYYAKVNLREGKMLTIERTFKIRKKIKRFSIVLLIASFVWSIITGEIIGSETGKTWLGIAIGISLFLILALLTFILAALLQISAE